MVNEAMERFGRLDCAVNNAGVARPRFTPAAEVTEAEWDANMDVNAKGVFLTNQAAVRHWLKAKQKGVIVNTASLAGKLGAPLLAHYSASKFAVVGFTQALAREMGPHGIRVNCVCPGFVRTSMQEREVVWEGKLRGMKPQPSFASNMARLEPRSAVRMRRSENTENVRPSVRSL